MPVLLKDARFLATLFGLVVLALAGLDYARAYPGAVGAGLVALGVVIIVTGGMP